MLIDRRSTNERANIMAYNPIKVGTQKTGAVADHCMVTIRRPNGAIETIRHPSIRKMDAVMLDRANKAMAAANRGEIISYANIDRAASYVVSAADAATDSTAQIERIMRAGE